MRLAWLAALVAGAVLTASATAATAPGGSVVSTGKPWSCTGPVNLASVTIAIRATDPSSDGVYLRSGCTGYIGSITVDQWHGDGIKVGVDAHDLEIGSITVHCYAHDAGKHQDGVQVMGSTNIRVDRGYVGCYSANDSQLMISEGAAQRQLPSNIIFDNITADPGGVQDPTHKPLYTYGRGGAYGVSIGQSANSGFTNLTLLSLANLHDLYQSTSAISPIWSFASLPAGVRATATIAP